MRDRGFAASLIERAKAAGCSALVLTLDLQIQGQRHRDLKNGLAVPPQLTLAHRARRRCASPRWALNVLRGRRKSFGNLEGRIPDAKSLTTLSQWIAGQFDPTLSWKDVEWVKKLWGGKLILKGILDAEDAKHRGAERRRRDRRVEPRRPPARRRACRRSARCREVVDAVGDATEVWLDGGIRSGQDVLKALALGARAHADRPRLRLRPGRDGRGRRARARWRSSSASSTSPWRCAACAACARRAARSSGLPEGDQLQALVGNTSPIWPARFLPKRLPTPAGRRPGPRRLRNCSCAIGRRTLSGAIQRLRVIRIRKPSWVVIPALAVDEEALEGARRHGDRLASRDDKIELRLGVGARRPCPSRVKRVVPALADRVFQRLVLARGVARGRRRTAPRLPSRSMDHAPVVDRSPGCP